MIVIKRKVENYVKAKSEAKSNATSKAKPNGLTSEEVSYIDLVNYISNGH